MSYFSIITKQINDNEFKDIQNDLVIICIKDQIDIDSEKVINLIDPKEEEQDIIATSVNQEQQIMFLENFIKNSVCFLNKLGRLIDSLYNQVLMVNECKVERINEHYFMTEFQILIDSFNSQQRIQSPRFDQIFNSFRENHENSVIQLMKFQINQIDALSKLNVQIRSKSKQNFKLPFKTEILVLTPIPDLKFIKMNCHCAGEQEAMLCKSQSIQISKVDIKDVFKTNKEILEYENENSDNDQDGNSYSLCSLDEDEDRPHEDEIEVIQINGELYPLDGSQLDNGTTNHNIGNEKSDKEREKPEKINKSKSIKHKELDQRTEKIGKINSVKSNHSSNKSENEKIEQDLIDSNEIEPNLESAGAKNDRIKKKSSGDPNASEIHNERIEDVNNNSNNSNSNSNNLNELIASETEKKKDPIIKKNNRFITDGCCNYGCKIN